MSLLVIEEIKLNVEKAATPKELGLVLPVYADALEYQGEPNKGWRIILARKLFPYKGHSIRNNSKPKLGVDYSWFWDNRYGPTKDRSENLAYYAYSEITLEEINKLIKLGSIFDRCQLDWISYRSSFKALNSLATILNE